MITKKLLQHLLSAKLLKDILTDHADDYGEKMNDQEQKLGELSSIEEDMYIYIKSFDIRIKGISEKNVMQEHLNMSVIKHLLHKSISNRFDVTNFNIKTTTDKTRVNPITHFYAVEPKNWLS